MLPFCCCCCALHIMFPCVQTLTKETGCKNGNNKNLGISTDGWNKMCSLLRKIHALSFFFCKFFLVCAYVCIFLFYQTESRLNTERKRIYLEHTTQQSRIIHARQPALDPKLKWILQEKKNTERERELHHSEFSDRKKANFVGSFVFHFQTITWKMPVSQSKIGERVSLWLSLSLSVACLFSVNFQIQMPKRTAETMSFWANRKIARDRNELL